MPQGFASYDLNQDGTITQDEWNTAWSQAGGGSMASASSYGGRGAGFNQGPYANQSAAWDNIVYPQASQPRQGGQFSPQDAVDFFTQMLSAFDGFQFTPEMLEAFGTVLPAMGIYGEFQKAQYQQDALAFAREELGIKGQELEIMKMQLDFQQGDYWDWYTNEFFPMTQEMQRLEWETQRGIYGEQTAQAREGTLQSKEATRQAQLASDVARWRALETMSEGGSRRGNQVVYGNPYTYGYG